MRNVLYISGRYAGRRKKHYGRSPVRRLQLPVISKDAIKELLSDNVGFQSRAEKINPGIASMAIMYYAAGQFMKAVQKSIFRIDHYPDR